MADLKWTNAAHPPPIKERLLLIVSAAGKPPDAQLMGTSEIVVGYWTGSTFRPMTVDHNDLGTAVDATHWAAIGPALPKGIAFGLNPYLVGMSASERTPKTTFLKGKAPQRRSIWRGFSDGAPLLAKVWKSFPVHLTG